MIELAAFLGNPGPQYAGNRHNAAWHLARFLPFYDNLSWKKKFKGLWAVIEGDRLQKWPRAEKTTASNFTAENQKPATESITEPSKPVPEKIHFIMPGTFMNRSGDSIAEAASFFKIKPENIIVIHDELELAPGTISLKFGGGLGGHNGLRSMKACFSTADFWRLRIGIGRPDSRLPGQGGREGSGEGITGWVLSDFTPEESAILEPVHKTAAALLLNVLVNGPEKYLPEWGKKKLADERENHIYQ